MIRMYKDRQARELFWKQKEKDFINSKNLIDKHEMNYNFTWGQRRKH